MKTLILFFITSPLYAQQCFTGVCNTPIVTHAPIVNKVVTQQDIVIDQRVVQFDADYFLGLNGYYQGYQKLQKSDDRVDRLLTLLERIVEQKGLVNPQHSQPQQPQVNPTDLSVYQIFKSKCASCHQQGGRGNIVLLGNENGRDFLIDLDCKDRIKVYSSVLSGKMPLDGQQLSDKEVQSIYEWMLKKAKE